MFPCTSIVTYVIYVPMQRMCRNLPWRIKQNIALEIMSAQKRPFGYLRLMLNFLAGSIVIEHFYI